MPGPRTWIQLFYPNDLVLPSLESIEIDDPDPLLVSSSDESVDHSTGIVPPSFSPLG
jgi:hypothetical protein